MSLKFFSSKNKIDVPFWPVFYIAPFSPTHFTVHKPWYGKISKFKPVNLIGALSY
jgi:hypothetical protein